MAQRVRTESAALRWFRAAVAVATIACGASQASAQDAQATTASTSLYVRTDSDRTTVVTPRVHVGAPIADQTRVDLVYTADIWTSASIDIRTSASKPVTEQRDELDVSLEHAFTDLTLGASYRYSKEHDYESQGGALGGSYDFADKNASLSVTGRAYFDRVGRAGDPGFWRAASTMSARSAFSQVIDTETIVQLAYELIRQQGYLSSPYRYVRIAADAGSLPSTCVYPVKMCVLEHDPSTRLRHAVALNARRALSSALSLGVQYRFYLDDWGVMSHTAGVDGAWVPGEGWLLSLAYRFYRQRGVVFYQPFYLAMPMPAHFTSDKELTTLSSHRVELELARRFRLDDAGTELRAILLVAPSYFSYQDFLPLDHIQALDTTVSFEVKL